MFAGIFMTLGQLLFIFLSLFLILIVLIQRGKGGGLSGAFGGMGGNTAFGTKTTDVLLKITIGVATSWIILAMILTCTMGVVDEAGRFPSAPSPTDLTVPGLDATSSGDLGGDSEETDPGPTSPGTAPTESTTPATEGAATEEKPTAPEGNE